MEETTLKVITPQPLEEPSRSQDERVRAPEPAPTPSSLNPSDLVLGYKETNGKPYIADFLEVSWLYKDPNMKEQMNTVDEWLRAEIFRLHLKASKQAYAGLFNDLVKKLGVHKYADASEKLKKASTILKEAVSKNAEYKRLGLDLQSLEEIYS